MSVLRLSAVCPFMMTAMSSIPSRSAVALMQKPAASVDPVLSPVAPS